MANEATHLFHSAAMMLEPAARCNRQLPAPCVANAAFDTGGWSGKFPRARPMLNPLSRQNVQGARTRLSNHGDRVDMQQARMAAAQEPVDRLARCIVLLALLCLAIVLICVWVLTRDYWIPAVLASSAVGLAAGIACHEFGHMLCAVLLSAPVQIISIGIGPVLWHCRVGETRFELRAVPCAGFVRCDPPIFNRLSRLLFLLGGVLGNVALIGLVSTFRSLVVQDPGHDYVSPVAFVQYYYILLNLMPFWTTAGGVRTGTDGLQLLQLACRTMSDVSSRN